MQCPLCSVTTRQAERHGLLFETCPTCRGAWLEAADLERVLDVLQRARDYAAPHDSRHDFDSAGHDHDHGHDHRDRRYDSDDDIHGGHRYGGHGRKRGLARLLDIFD